MVDSQDYYLAIHPSEGLIFLISGFGYVLGADTLLAHMSMVSLNEDPSSRLVGINNEDWSHLHIVRQQGNDGVPLRSRMFFEGYIFDTKIFPHRNRTPEKRAESTLPHDRRRESLKISRHPIPYVLPGVKQYAGLRQTEIRHRAIRGAV